MFIHSRMSRARITIIFYEFFLVKDANVTFENEHSKYINTRNVTKCNKCSNMALEVLHVTHHIFMLYLSVYDIWSNSLQ